MSCVLLLGFGFEVLEAADPAIVSSPRTLDAAINLFQLISTVPTLAEREESKGRGEEHTNHHEKHPGPSQIRLAHWSYAIDFRGRRD